MSFTPFARFRNFTLDNLKAIFEWYPDLPENKSWSEVIEDINSVAGGYKRTAYQQACQFGLEDRSSEYFKVHTYLFSFSDYNLKRYLEFWFKTYYAPNPYCNSNEEPFLIFCEFSKELLRNENHSLNYTEYFNKRFGGGSSDILLNCFKSYGKPLTYDNNSDTLYVAADNIETLRKQISFIEKTFPVPIQNNQRSFFERYDYCNFKKFFGEQQNSEDEYVDFRIILGKNTLLYGVPGSGKSYTVQNVYCKDAYHVERVVFHPDYTNSDFIGQIQPIVQEGIVKYNFIPGPFTSIVRDAYNNPDKKFVLVIEEINRGNAPAIFGEVFQLLDRITDSDIAKAKGLPVGTSEYEITNSNMAKEIYGDEKHKVRIPSNLSIVATMNTSDQNVFTLDTAFKRRWQMKCIRNDFENCKLSNNPIGSTGIKWKTFAEQINGLIINNGISNISSEDKRLGAYFVTAEELQDDRQFAEKVLAYLWDDVFKYDRSVMFNAQYTTLEDVVDGFVSYGIDVFGSNLQQTLNTVKEDA